MASRMKAESRTNQCFRGRIQGKELIVQIKTREGRVARYFEFRSGHIHSVVGLHESPTLVLNFLNTQYAYDILKNSRHDSARLIRHLNKKHLIADGDVAVMTWFIDIAQHISLSFLPWKKTLSVSS